MTGTVEDQAGGGTPLPAHYSAEAIATAVAAVSATFSDIPEDDAAGAVYARLARPVAEEFTRWFLGEINRGTAPARLEFAVIRVAGWMVATFASHAREPHQAVVALMGSAKQDALRFLGAGVVDQVAPERGGHA